MRIIPYLSFIFGDYNVGKNEAPDGMVRGSINAPVIAKEHWIPFWQDPFLADKFVVKWEQRSYYFSCKTGRIHIASEEWNIKDDQVPHIAIPVAGTKHIPKGEIEMSYSEAKSLCDNSKANKSPLKVEFAKMKKSFLNDIQKKYLALSSEVYVGENEEVVANSNISDAMVEEFFKKIESK